MAILERFARGKAALPISETTGKLLWASLTLKNRPDSVPVKMVDFPVGEYGEYFNAEKNTVVPVLSVRKVPEPLPVRSDNHLILVIPDIINRIAEKQFLFVIQVGRTDKGAARPVVQYILVIAVVKNIILVVIYRGDG